MSCHDEYKALLRLCFSGEPSVSDAKLIDQSLNDDTIIPAHFRMMPLLFKRVPESYFSAESWVKIKGHYRYTRYRNRLLMHRAQKFQQQVNSGPVVLMKGLALALGCYADIGERPMADIDALMPNLPISEEALNSLLERLSMTSKGDSLVAVTLVDNEGFEYDLHRRLQSTELGKAVMTCAVEEAENIDYQGVQFKVLCPEHQFVLVLCHAGRSPFVRYSKRWVFDALELLNRFELDVAKVLAFVNLLSVPRFFKDPLVELVDSEVVPPQLEKLLNIREKVPNKGRFLHWLQYLPTKFEGDGSESYKRTLWAKVLLDAYVVKGIQWRGDVSYFLYLNRLLCIGGYSNWFYGLCARIKRRLSFLLFRHWHVPSK